ncbi:hypothetical protein BGZ57DRAFT_923234 [Hyaloscypha finlandica]|nr:hypothetical protein BGZ57DRAFT_923234 [Hyaloscypha finlandica]
MHTLRGTLERGAQWYFRREKYKGRWATLPLRIPIGKWDTEEIQRSTPQYVPMALSSDAAIAIVFGLIGASLSFVGVIIACLTLRFMTLERYERHRRVRGDDHEPVFQHLHTHLFPSSQQQWLGNRDPKVA